jgi:hypothetical protein
MNSWRLFRASPLSRHPSLFLRKVLEKAGKRGDRFSVPPPPPLTARYPAPWAPALRSWLQHVPLHPPPHPFARVFGHDFEEDLLLRLCREGPPPGARGLTADIKLVWDYSRGQPLFTNAAAGPAQLAGCAAFLERWLAVNQKTAGRAWNCPMDVAIRAVNWVLADALFDGALGARVGESAWAGWLWRHGWLTWQNLEALLVSSNHYLSNLLGLCVIGAAFPDDPAARRWRRFAEADFPRALLAQTRPDGGLYEASLRYHAYVTEMALLFRLAQGRPFPPAVEQRLRAMCQVIADFQDATGDVFPFGDDDSGRVLAVDFASPLGRAEIVLKLATSLLGQSFQPAAEAIYPDSGWWVRRVGDFTLAFEFGGVGFHGQGGHAQNDDFSVALNWRGHPFITDPGTFIYTADTAARNRFKSTFAHNTLVLDGQEQRAFTSEPFELRGDDAAFPAERLGAAGWAFTRPLAPGIAHRREVRVDASGIRIRDQLRGEGRHRLQWRFSLHPAVEAAPTPDGFELTIPGTGRLRLAAHPPLPGLAIVAAEYSRGYGWNEPTRACVADGEFALPFSVEWRLA